MLISQEGMMVRCAVKDVRTTGRASQGVRLINIKGKDTVASIARVAPRDEEEVDKTLAVPPKAATEPEVPTTVAEPPAPQAKPPKAAAKPKPAAANAKATAKAKRKR